MHPEVEELRTQLKEILYDCAVEIRATKAALYLLDASIGRFELVTEYGFRSVIRHAADLNDPLIDRCVRTRNPFFVNGLMAEPRLSEILFEASTDRLLAAPILSRGQLVGLIDMRDKAAKQPFENADLPKAQSIAERVLALFTSKNVFNQRYITLSQADDAIASTKTPPPTVAPEIAVPKAAPAPAPAKRAERPATQRPHAAAPPQRRVPIVAAPEPLRELHLNDVITAGRVAAARIIVPPAGETIGDNELVAIREILRAVLLLPGVAVAAFSATGSSGGVLEVAAKGSMTDGALTALQSKLKSWLSKHGEELGALKASVETPLGLLMSPIGESHLHKVFTAPVNAGSMRGLYLTVAFLHAPEQATHELMALLLNQLQTSIEYLMARTNSVNTRLRTATKLVEPEFTRYPELRRHSEAVTALTDAFTRFLSLSAADAEIAKLTAIVHDVGMRFLDHDRLYRKRELTPDEMAILKEHVNVGALIVEPFLGTAVARAVLCHHEHVDGNGYPNHLQEYDIPLASRIVQICDAYFAMTDAGTYQQREPPDVALAAITAGAGTQFDHDLAHRFVEMMTRGA